VQCLQNSVSLRQSHCHNRLLCENKKTLKT